MRFQSWKNSQLHQSSAKGGFGNFFSFQGTILRNRQGVKANLLCVSTIDYADEFSSKSDVVTWGPQVDLTWNDPIIMIMDIMIMMIIIIKIKYIFK